MSKNNMKVQLTLGSTRLTVDCNNYSWEVMEELREAVAEIRRSTSVFMKYPMEEGESREKWAERVGPQMETDLTRKEGETPGEHLKRMFETKADIHEMAPEILNAICKAFGLKEVSLEEFKKGNWLDTKSFIYDVLNLGDIPADDYYPKRLLS